MTATSTVEGERARAARPSADAAHGRGPNGESARALLRSGLRARSRRTGDGVRGRPHLARRARIRRPVRRHLVLLGRFHALREPVRHRRRRLSHHQAGRDPGDRRLRRKRDRGHRVTGMGVCRQLPRGPGDAGAALSPGLASRPVRPRHDHACTSQRQRSVRRCGQPRSQPPARRATCSGPSPCSSTLPHRC